jgi:hypothetical protein
VRELVVLDREHEHRSRLEVEGRRVLLKLAVESGRLGEQLVDPRCRLTEEEAAVPPGSARADAAALDEDDRLAVLGEKARRRTAGDAGADDDCVG